MEVKYLPRTVIKTCSFFEMPSPAGPQHWVTKGHKTYPYETEHPFKSRFNICGLYVAKHTLFWFFIFSCRYAVCLHFVLSYVMTQGWKPKLKTCRNAKLQKQREMQKQTFYLIVTNLISFSSILMKMRIFVFVCHVALPLEAWHLNEMCTLVNKLFQRIMFNTSDGLQVCGGCSLRLEHGPVSFGSGSGLQLSWAERNWSVSVACVTRLSAELRWEDLYLLARPLGLFVLLCVCWQGRSEGRIDGCSRWAALTTATLKCACNT